LAEYYAGPGKDDPVTIQIDPGGYLPRFERRSTQAPGQRSLTVLQRPAKPGNRVLPYLAVAVVAAFAGFGVAIYLDRQDQPQTGLASRPSTSQDRSPERRALMDKSPASLQAVNLAEQARDLIFPLFEREQVMLTLGMFRHAILKDETYFGGYAGAAQALAALAVFEPDGTARDAHLVEAQAMANRAEQLGATQAWSQSAMSWVSLVSGRYDEALRRARQALELAPRDGNILDFHAIIMLCLGEFEEARNAGTAVRLTATDRIATRGFLGAANFHLGKYRESIAALNSSAMEGSPISAPTLAYLIAAHQVLGEPGEAQRYAVDLAENWPFFRADEVLGRLYRDQAQADAVHKRLLLAGWTITQ
jgi:tetratricopeptide (TPR) repeat protein